MRILMFDIDGTLLLTGGVGTRSFKKAFEDQYGTQADMSCYSPWGATDYEIAGSLLKHHFPERDIEIAEVDALLNLYLGCFKAALPGDLGFRILPSALACLETMADLPDTLVGVATGNLSHAAWPKLEKAGMHHWIRFGGFAEDGPQRATILQAAKERAVAMVEGPVQSIWVIGDTPKDIHAARAISANVVAVATGKFGRAELAEHDPDILLDDLSELAAKPHLLT